MPARSAARRSAASPSTSAPICSRRSPTRSWPARRSCTSSATRPGATRTDGWIDIEGGAGTLFSFSSKGRRELPNGRILIDGAVEPLSKGGSFVGQHVFTSLQGVAVHINAFNFPVWGMLEKLGPTLLAGVPAIVKPASATGYLAEAAFRIMIEADILPPARCSW
jgi:oxepin-CoA hydrolase/3-oxo-5,6-dehydrosuberyl-CoA semialdehyde dehydrogenase